MTTSCLCGVPFFLVSLLWPLSPAPVAAQVDLPATGQVSCWDSNGTVISCADTGDDGDLQEGVAWPTPRFTDLGNCMLDELTGLVWAKDADILMDTPSWEEALAWAEGLSLCGEMDWRIPNAVEMRSLYHAEEDSRLYLAAQGFSNVGNSYWTSTTGPSVASTAIAVGLAGGGAGHTNKFASSTFRAWPVRGQPSPPAATWRTGQVNCFDEGGTEIDCMDTGQDGDWQAGAPWPAPRFTVNGDGTVTDELTGLVWSEDAFVPGPPACNPAAIKSWNGVHEYIACLNDRAFQGHTDWTFPNLTQLSSLVDYGGAAPALPVGHPFLNVNVDLPYWSSTTAAYVGEFGWAVDMTDGSVDQVHKGQAAYVWPLRAVPEPAAALLLAVGAGTLLAARRLRGAARLLFSWESTRGGGAGVTRLRGTGPGSRRAARPRPPRARSPGRGP